MSQNIVYKKCDLNQESIEETPFQLSKWEIMDNELKKGKRIKAILNIFLHFILFGVQLLGLCHCAYGLNFL